MVDHSIVRRENNVWNRPDNETTRVTGLAIQDSILDVALGESFIDYPWDKVAMDKAREPLGHNARVCFDPISKITLSELAWFFDPFRQERVPISVPTLSRRCVNLFEL